jgi:hypothetical protein
MTARRNGTPLVTRSLRDRSAAIGMQQPVDFGCGYCRAEKVTLHFLAA